TEVALEGAARLARGLDHHVEEGGTKHGRSRDENPDVCIGAKFKKLIQPACGGLTSAPISSRKHSCKDRWMAGSRQQRLPKLASARAGGHGGCGLPADRLCVKNGAGAALSGHRPRGFPPFPPPPQIPGAAVAPPNPAGTRP